MLDQIIAAEPRPPRQIDDTIPRELERICLKALAEAGVGAVQHRPGTWPRTCGISSRPRGGTAAAARRPAARPAVRPDPTQDAPPIAPVPGGPTPTGRPSGSSPRGCGRSTSTTPTSSSSCCPAPATATACPRASGSGRPGSSRPTPTPRFEVGLIYGPSGCGKSSLVKAGLLPRLGKDVLPVYIEATPEETEARLLRGLRKVCPELPAGLGLVDSLAALRRGRVLPSGQKVLLVLDQFEQWLFARRGEADTELVAALRQCDGEHVQAVVMVRDDFWMAATRFMRDLEIRLVEGENSAAVDLFDPLHARKVLAAFGRAYGVLPEKPAELDARPAGVPRPGGRGAGPGRQGHLGPAGAVRRDGQGEALDAGDA